jgi:hypothetical protein
LNYIKKADFATLLDTQVPMVQDFLNDSDANNNTITAVVCPQLPSEVASASSLFNNQSENARTSSSNDADADSFDDNNENDEDYQSNTDDESDDNCDQDEEDDESYQIDKKRTKKRKVVNSDNALAEANCALLSSQRIDESIVSVSSFIVKQFKFYINLLSDYDPYVKCGFSSMDDIKVSNQYTRDRICSSTIFVPLKHKGPGVNLLYDSILKYRLREFLYQPSEDNEPYTALRIQILESIKVLRNSDIIVTDAAEYVAEKHELYLKDNVDEILAIMVEIAGYSLQDLKTQGFEVESLKDTRPTKSRFLTQRYKSDVYVWWNEKDLHVYKEGIDAVASFGTEGGGSLPLNCNGVANLGLWLNNMHSGFLGFEEFNVLDVETVINILWVGIGFAEEAVLLIKQFEYFNTIRDHSICLKIYGLELHNEVVEIASNIVASHRCNGNISILVANILDVDDEFCIKELPERIDIIYTSGAFHELINFKLISLAVTLKAVLLCSRGTVNTITEIYKELGLGKQHRPMVCVHAELYQSETDGEAPESRTIFICKYPHNHISNKNVYDHAINMYSCNYKTIQTETWFLRMLEHFRNIHNGVSTIDESYEVFITGVYSDFLESITIDIDDADEIVKLHQQSNQRLLRDKINKIAEIHASIITEEVIKKLRLTLSLN